MKILFVANTLPPTDLSGVGEQVMQLSRGLEGLGHEVRILGRGDDGARGPKLAFPLMVVLPFLRELRRFRPDVVQVHESDGAVAALLVKILSDFLSPRPLLSALLQVSYVEEWRAVRTIRYRGRVLGRPSWRERRFRWFKAPVQIVLGSMTTWLSDRVLAPSRATAAELTRDYLASDVAVVPNAMGSPDDDVSMPDAATNVEKSPILLFVGRLRLRKGVEVALHALASLDALRVPARLEVVGEGEHRARLERLTAELGLEDRVEFLGRRSRPEVARRMSEAAALVVPSLYEGMPLVIVEAMQRGLAVVASAVSGIPDVVSDPETGWLVPAEDPAALARAFQAVLSDPRAARQRGAAGRARLDQEYSPAVVAGIWLRALGLEESRAARTDPAGEIA